MADRIPTISWPGVDQPISCQYTLSQGISPGIAVLSILPQDATRIALQGDLVLSDGVGTVRLKNCKVLRVRSTLDPITGETWTLEIQDRRWRWLATGFVNGTYNVIDSSRDVTRPPEGAGPYLAGANIYVPWTVRSPHQLLKQCLDAMGERNYRIDAPNQAYPLPPINWDFTNAAQALSRLCETLGCRVVYRPDTDTVWIVRVGIGSKLPEGEPGTIYRDAPGIKTPSRPDSIILVGAPVKYQVEWVLEAVGEEWDKSFKPIDALSYAPPLQGARQHRVDITPSALIDASVLTVTIEYLGEEWTVQHTMSGTTVASATAALATKINDKLGPFGIVASDQTTYVKILGPATGEMFSVRTSTVGGSTLRWELIQGGGVPASRWDGEWPYAGFHLRRTAEDFEADQNLAALTNRLTYREAVRLANGSVFRYYRIVNINVESLTGPQEVPEYGKLDQVGGIKRVMLLNEQLDQTVPAKQDEQIFGADGFPITRDFYDGLFKLKPARCFGSHFRNPQGYYRKDSLAGFATGPDAEVLVDFSIIPERSMIVFNEPVFLWDPEKGTRPAQIRLRCACHLRDAYTNQIVRFTYKYDFPGPKLGTAPAVIQHHDVERLVKVTYKTYEDRGVSRGYTVTRDQVLVNDPEVAERARYYLTAAAAKYQTPLSGERQYNGIQPVFCDGAILQVTWSISTNSGAETVASLNFEHQIYVPQYPERLRLEYLRNIAEAAESKPAVEDMMTPPGKSGGNGGAGKGGYGPSGGGWG